MMTWKHSGFNIDTSVRIEADDRTGMQRLIEYKKHLEIHFLVFLIHFVYISRRPFSLARMIKITDGGKVLYRASLPDCTPYPELGMELSLHPARLRQNLSLNPKYTNLFWTMSSSLKIAEGEQPACKHDHADCIDKTCFFACK